MFSNGRTAMEAFSDNGADGHHFQALKPARSASKTAAMEAARTPKEVLRARGWDARCPARDPRVDLKLSRPSIRPRTDWRLPEHDVWRVAALR